ncbi:MAG TPA: hypothetical protein VEX13_08135 [Chloroflexia bacterium]|nr:hypothetical protein [Chloroflexia bacterium]
MKSPEARATRLALISGGPFATHYILLVSADPEDNPTAQHTLSTSTFSSGLKVNTRRFPLALSGEEPTVCAAGPASHCKAL